METLYYNLNVCLKGCP